MRRFDAKCAEWDEFYFLGESPTGAAARRPGDWQLVYELRPLELIPYWLGIPFKPHHPVYAIIFDADTPAYYTAPAVKVTELGRPVCVEASLPLARLLELFSGVDTMLRRTSERISAFIARALKLAERFEHRTVLRRREVRRERSHVQAA